jgi:hypothetical protein
MAQRQIVTLTHKELPLPSYDITCDFFLLAPVDLKDTAVPSSSEDLRIPLYPSPIAFLAYPGESRPFTQEPLIPNVTISNPGF